jgi:galactose oxidase
MPLNCSPRRAALLALLLVTAAFWTAQAGAQVKEITVGVTPSCPYGINACWAGAYESLTRLDGVKSASETPDAYNCTAGIVLKSGGLPDVAGWAQQFKKFAGQTYVLRGVEVTVEGTLEGQGDSLAVRVPGVDQPITLAPLRHKLQWNFKKAAARQPEPDELDAFSQLAVKQKDAKNATYKLHVTGPLRKADSGYVLEVREFIPLNPGTDPYGRK